MLLPAAKEKMRLCLTTAFLFASFFVASSLFFKPAWAEEAALSQPKESSDVSPLDRLNSGFANIFTGPLELINQLREEVKRRDLPSAIVPGVVKGVGWFAVREGVGIFELVTFFMPWEPHLEPMNLDWLMA
ncbi:MAG: exosortase system-associated protein, TIGR04073 family [Candidatus Omnitrophica bacterium]|nr:exosortase system-associated protein, TIGR04073 family [Candidatus Omnitrophota bacterium]